MQKEKIIQELEELKIQKNEMNLPYRIIHRQTTK